MNTQTKNAEPVEGFTGGEWKIIKGHPVFDNDILIMSEIEKTEKVFGKGYLICIMPDIRGDSFKYLEPGQAEANAALIAESKNMYDALKELKLQFALCLGSLDDADNDDYELLDKVEGILNRINNK